MDLSVINKVSRMDNFLPTKKFVDLEPGKTYKITGLKQINTTFGGQVTMELENEFQVFLPARISKAFQEHPEEFQQMAQASIENHLYVRPLGGKYNQCEFIYM